ncbi:hypothetical protein GOV11_05005 [Candidatus Woesearchaeota archaeon]|nr:hypothetical protein [Candidatus Woesearchaeota archaeon]
MRKALALTAMLMLPVSTLSNDILPKAELPENIPLKNYIYINRNIFQDNLEQRFGIEIPDHTYEFNKVQSYNLLMEFYFDDSRIVVYDADNKDFDEFEVRPTIYHELTHVYVTGLMKSLGNELGEGWKIKPLPDQVIICEGIAEHVGVLSGNLRLPFYEFPKIVTDFKKQAIKVTGLKYRYGRQIVDPIFKELGVKEGIDAIFKHRAFTWNDLTDPETYQREVIDSVKTN